MGRYSARLWTPTIRSKPPSSVKDAVPKTTMRAKSMYITAAARVVPISQAARMRENNAQAKQPQREGEAASSDIIWKEI